MRKSMPMRISFVTIVLVLAAAIAPLRPAVPAMVRAGGDPAPLAGVPLRAQTGLRLVVADNPPFVLDVDSRRVTPLRDLAPQRRGVLWVVGIGGRSARSVWRHADLYAVRGRAGRVSSLGDGADVVPAADGRSAWVKSFGRSGCSIRQLSLDGRVIRAPRAFPCASTIASGGALGLVVNRTRVIEPRDGRTLLRTRWGVLAAAGRTLVLAGPGKMFTVLDTASREQRRVPWPDTVGGLDTPAVDPRGRFVALAFGSPGGAQQVLDIWLLDTKTMRLSQLPGMPALVSLKATNMAWTHDGQLVLLGESSGRDVVALWRPGEKRLALKTVQLPDRDSGSDSFAVLR